MIVATISLLIDQRQIFECCLGFELQVVRYSFLKLIPMVGDNVDTVSSTVTFCHYASDDLVMWVGKRQRTHEKRVDEWSMIWFYRPCVEG